MNLTIVEMRRKVRIEVRVRAVQAVLLERRVKQTRA